MGLDGLRRRATRARSRTAVPAGGEPGPTRSLLRTGSQPEVSFVLSRGACRCAVPGRGEEGLRLRPEPSGRPGEVCEVLAGQFKWKLGVCLRRGSVAGGDGDHARADIGGWG